MTFEQWSKLTTSAGWSTGAQIRMSIFDDGAQLFTRVGTREINDERTLRPGTYTVQFDLSAGEKATNLYWLTEVTTTSAPAPGTDPIEEPVVPEPATPDVPARPQVSSTTYTMPTGDLYPFGPKSWLRMDVQHAPTHPDSAALVENLGRQVADANGGSANFNHTSWNSSYAVVDDSVPEIRVAFNDWQKKGYTPRELYQSDRGAHFDHVPLPAGMQPPAGTDATITIYRPSTDQLWEFWKAARSTNGTWSAVWGGRLDQVSESVGCFFPDGMGASATGVASSLGTLSFADVERGYAEHALAIVIPRTSYWTQFSWPAQRSDGRESPLALHTIPQGLRLHLDPKVDVSGMNPICATIARTAQRYGITVLDTGGTVSFVGERGDWKPVLGKDGGYNVLRAFPWAKMRALPVDYGRP